MQIGDTTPQPSKIRDVPDQWDNGDRALLRELFMELGMQGLMGQGDPSQLIKQFKDDIAELQKQLLPKLPPFVQVMVTERIQGLDGLLTDIQNAYKKGDTQTQSDATTKLMNNLSSLQNALNDYL
jgi:hypothetical protein